MQCAGILIQQVDRSPDKSYDDAEAEEFQKHVISLRVQKRHYKDEENDCDDAPKDDIEVSPHQVRSALL